LNNQKARLQVGDQVPVATASAVSTLTSGAPVVNTIEYRDTGVILEITPRVNANGLVMLDLAQEVSGVSSTTTSSLNSPTIQQRRISSSVAVEDGQTIALGGLIQDNRTESRTGIPVLQNLPYVGALFGVRTKSLTRTELVVLMTPHVVHNRKSAEDITAELRSKLPLLAPPVYVVRPAPVP
jgi:general secretion pathway protein D